MKSSSQVFALILLIGFATLTANAAQAELLTISDLNHSGFIDDADIEMAISHWALGTLVPGLGRELSDWDILFLIENWVRANPIAHGAIATTGVLHVNSLSALRGALGYVSQFAFETQHELTHFHTIELHKAEYNLNGQPLLINRSGIKINGNGALITGAPTLLEVRGAATEIRGLRLHGGRVGVSLNHADDVWVEDNSIRNNNIGILIRGRTERVVIRNNNISGNKIGLSAPTLFGQSDAVIFAQHNWWGAINGPRNSSHNPNGLGNPVIGLAKFQPHLKHPTLDENAEIVLLELKAPATAKINQPVQLRATLSNKSAIEGVTPLYTLIGGQFATTWLEEMVFIKPQSSVDVVFGFSFVQPGVYSVVLKSPSFSKTHVIEVTL